MSLLILFSQVCFFLLSATFSYFVCMVIAEIIKSNKESKTKKAPWYCEPTLPSPSIPKK